jgi:hypothetical protein
MYRMRQSNGLFHILTARHRSRHVYHHPCSVLPRSELVMTEQQIREMQFRGSNPGALAMLRMELSPDI